MAAVVAEPPAAAAAPAAPGDTPFPEPEEPPLGAIEVEADAIAEERAAHEAEVRNPEEDPPPAAPPTAPATALLSLDEVARRIDPNTLRTLEEKFRGKLSRVRHLDERDALF